jgi:hypothetical protein
MEGHGPDDHLGHPVGEIAIYPDAVWNAARSLTPVPSRTVRHRSARNGHGRTRSARRLSQGFRQPGP